MQGGDVTGNIGSLCRHLPDRSGLSIILGESENIQQVDLT
jgi:hypothetical protein